MSSKYPLPGKQKERIFRDKTPHEGEPCYYPFEPHLHDWTAEKEKAFRHEMAEHDEVVRKSRENEQAREFGTPAYCRKKRNDYLADQRKVEDTCKVSFYPDGMGLRLERRLDGYSFTGEDYRPELKGEGDNRRIENSENSHSKRGKVSQFSARSRGRMLDMVYKLDKNAVPIMITLTYPADWWQFTPAQVKMHLDHFARVLERHYPRAAFIWKLEFQDRGAPHYHLLIWNAKPWYKDVARWWWEVVGSGDPAHLKAGTKVEALRSYRGTLSYCGKAYMGKESATPPGQNWGRLWGVRRRERLPWAKPVEDTFPARVGVHYARLMRHYHHANGRNIKVRSRVAWILTEHQARWMDALEWAYGMYEVEAKATREFQLSTHTEPEPAYQPEPEEIIYGCREARDEVDKWGISPLLGGN